MGIKPKDKSTLQVPGPGSYDLNTNFTNKAMPAFSISGKVNWEKKLETPGPGQYKLPEKVIEGPKFGFGTGPRTIEKAD